MATGEELFGLRYPRPLCGGICARVCSIKPLVLLQVLLALVIVLEFKDQEARVTFLAPAHD